MATRHGIVYDLVGKKRIGRIWRLGKDFREGEGKDLWEGEGKRSRD